MRPERGRVLIARPSGMAALERAFLGHALYAVIIGQPRTKVTPEALAAAVEFECGILPSQMTVEVSTASSSTCSLLQTSGCCIALAWLRNPSAVPKVLTVSVPAPALQPWKPDSDDENAHSPPRPLSPTDRRCIDYTVIMHVKEVIDRGPLLTEGLADEFLPDEVCELVPSPNSSHCKPLVLVDFFALCNNLVVAALLLDLLPLVPPPPLLPLPLSLPDVDATLTPLVVEVVAACAPLTTVVVEVVAGCAPPVGTDKLVLLSTTNALSSGIL
ncbi:hypothetical protein D1007_48082 [Hordeum vulgare]|nr:hypothetical protein D1007_48082 [Hordeum vulgare]